MQEGNNIWGRNRQGKGGGLDHISVLYMFHWPTNQKGSGWFCRKMTTSEPNCPNTFKKTLPALTKTWNFSSEKSGSVRKRYCPVANRYNCASTGSRITVFILLSPPSLCLEIHTHLDLWSSKLKSWSFSGSKTPHMGWLMTERVNLMMVVRVIRAFCFVVGKGNSCEPRPHFFLIPKLFPFHPILFPSYIITPSTCSLY